MVVSVGPTIEIVNTDIVLSKIIGNEIYSSHQKFVYYSLAGKPICLGSIGLIYLHGADWALVKSL
jgi:hypothetical protein